MRIGAYQFAVTGDWNKNLSKIQNAILQAQAKGVKLLVFPECALTGYPPIDIKKASLAAFGQMTYAYAQL